MNANKSRTTGRQPVKALLIVMSYHHHNTEKLAGAFAKVLGAPVKTPQQVTIGELAKYDLIGFGSGIYSDTHHPLILDLADRLPTVAGKKVFLFSTSGIPAFIAGDNIIEGYCIKSHRKLREKLVSKGYTVVDEFGCAGFNTNSFLRLFGGFNKTRPDARDLHRAETFATRLRMDN